MNSLDLLISRIKATITVSNEDAVEAVKQYWDEAVDTVKNYWKDVDEEIVEETGIPKASLTSLLDDHRQGHTYANYGGTSGVASYDLGEDWILVNFTTGSKYLYTIKSSTREQLEEMKRYANDGKGLNSYIMRVQKTNYAGRNVKGEILIKPGMEQFSASANKRLQLLYAFRNTVMPMASNEGFFESIKKFMGVSNKGTAKKMYNSFNGVDDLLKNIRSNFGNPGWIDKQTFLTGPIDNAGIGDVLSINGKVDIFKAIDAASAYIPALQREAKAIEAWRSKTKPVFDYLVKNAAKLNDAVYDEAKAMLTKIGEPIPVTNASPDKPFTGKITYSSDKMVSGKYVPNDVKLEALSESDAKKATAMILKCLEDASNARFSWPEVPAKLDRLVYTMEDSPKDIGSHTYFDWQDLYMSVVMCPVDGPSLRARESFMQTIYACAKWIDRSIKGNITVEDFPVTVSHEGIGEMIGKLAKLITGKDEHGVRKTDKKPGQAVKDHEKWYTQEGQKQTKALEDALKRFYLNDTWLDNQKLVEGTIDAKDFSGILCFNGKVGNTPLDNVRKGIQWREQFAKTWYPILANTASKANAIVDRLAAQTKGASLDDEKAIDIVRKGIVELEAIPDPMAKLPKPQGMGLGNMVPYASKHGNLTYLEVKEGKPVETVDKLPALNKEQIKVAANLILEVLDWEPVMEYISWPDFGDGMAFIDWIYEADNDVYMDLYDRFSQQGCDQLWCDPVRNLVRTRAVASALERWIDRSIHGEASNERYDAKMTSTLLKYKSYIKAAGADGLDPIARQFMAVGLESMGKPTKVSIEGFTDTQEGDDINDRIDSLLSGSTESFWSDIKDFFAGRPTKIHLSGRDRGLKAKLDRTINDRTWLSRQSYTLGEVKYSALPDFTVATANTYVSNYRQSVRSVTQHNEREIAKVTSRLEIVPNTIRAYASRDNFDLQQIQTALASINPYTLRFNVSLKEPELLPTLMTPQVGPALTKLEIKDFAALLGDLHNVQTGFENSITVKPNLPWMEQIRFRYTRKPDGDKVIAAINQLVAAYTNILTMVNREIKQSITTHATWINAENIADSMVNYIAKSITNVTSNGMESYIESKVV